MRTDSEVSANLPRANLGMPSWSAYAYGYNDWRLRLDVTRPASQESVYSATFPFLPWFRRMAELRKLEERSRERLAGVWLDEGAQRLLGVLDRETSIPWEDLRDKTGSEWSEVCRSVGRLAGANLCEVSSTRFRLSDYGDELLAELSQSGHSLPLPFGS